MRPRFEVGWSHAALWALRELHWRDAERVDAAVLRFAATGQGPVELIQGNPRRFFLRVPPYRVRMSADPFSRTLTVWWIFRR